MPFVFLFIIPSSGVIIWTFPLLMFRVYRKDNNPLFLSKAVRAATGHGIQFPDR